MWPLTLTAFLWQTPLPLPGGPTGSGISLTDWIQAGSTVVIAFLTAALIGVTAWYAWHTKRMADIMTLEYESRGKPLLFFQRGPRGHKDGGYFAIAKLSNEGVSSLNVYALELIWWFLDKPEKVHRARKDFADRFALEPRDKLEFILEVSDDVVSGVALLEQIIRIPPERIEAGVRSTDWRPLVDKQLHGRLRVQYYPGGMPLIQNGNVQKGLSEQVTPPFRFMDL